MENLSQKPGLRTEDVLIALTPNDRDDWSFGRGEAPYPEGVSYDDFDAWNAKFVEARRGVKLSDVVAELEASHRDFVAAARALPDEQFAPETAGRGLIENCTSQHYREHAGQIREWRRKESE